MIRRFKVCSVLDAQCVSSKSGKTPSVCRILPSGPLSVGQHVAALGDYRSSSSRTSSDFRNIYALLGDWFAWACLVGLADVAILGVRSRR
jgi:hypothetical protein